MKQIGCGHPVSEQIQINTAAVIVKTYKINEDHVKQQCVKYFYTINIYFYLPCLQIALVHTKHNRAL